MDLVRMLGKVARVATVAAVLVVAAVVVVFAVQSRTTSASERNGNPAAGTPGASHGRGNGNGNGNGHGRGGLPDTGLPAAAPAAATLLAAGALVLHRRRPA